MSMSKTFFWITMALCATVGCCEDFYSKTGGTVKMNCGDEASSVDIDWKHNNSLIIRKIGKTGRLTRGSTNLGKKAKLILNSLEIPSISNDDFGDYTCNGVQHKLYVASAFASYPHVLVSSETKLSCDIKGLTATFKWTSPNNVQHETTEVTLNSVSLNDNGHWTCQITAHGKEIIKLGVDLTVVGPLNITEKVMVYPGGDAKLPCVLLNPGRLSIKEAEWTRDPSTEPLLKATTTSDLKWNSTYDFKSRFTYSDKPLADIFDVTIKNVGHFDAGVYVCTLVFEGGKRLSAKLQVVVEGERVPDPKDSKVKKEILHKSILGVKLWIWIAVGASSFLLIGLVVIIVLVHRRNKLIKRQIRKMKSSRQPLEPREYCECSRPLGQPRAGKRVKPPPLSRQHYNALTD